MTNEEKTPLLSVIVPVYNVEKYLHACVDSILNQTYKNTEVILVDDGSTDGCGALCDTLARRHANVIAVHKKNGGLASARNAGLEVAKGDFITFIDSDDSYGTLDSLSICMNYLLADSTIDIAQMPMLYSFTDESKNYLCYSCEPTILDGVKAILPRMDAYRYGECVSNSACNKIFRKSSIADKQFVHIYAEDIFFMLGLLESHLKIVVQPKGSYVYFQRDGSIMNSELSEAKITALIKIYTRFYRFALNNHGCDDVAAQSLLVVESYLKQLRRKFGKKVYLENIPAVSRLPLSAVQGPLKRRVQLLGLHLLGLKAYSRLYFGMVGLAGKLKR